MEKPVLEHTTPLGATRAKSNDVRAAVKEASPMAITFPQGLIGCPDWQHFTLWPEPFDGWGELISTDHDGLGLIVADPAFLRVHYHLEIDEDEVEVLQLTTPDDVQILCILSLRREEQHVSLVANLAGPLVINSRTGLGKQVVLDHTEYPLRAPILEGDDARAFMAAFAAGSASTGTHQQTPAKDAGEGASSC